MGIFKRREQDEAPEPQPQDPLTDPTGLDDGNGEGPSLLSMAASFSWRILVVLLAVAVAVNILVRLRLVVLPVVLALFVTALLAPPAQRLKNRGWHPILATWTVLLASIGIVVGLVAAVAPSVADQFDEVGISVQRGTEDVLDWLARSPLELSEQDINRYIDQASQQLSANRDRITSGVLTGATKLLEVLTGFFLMLVLVFFFVKDGPNMFRWFESLFPARNRRHVRAIGERAWATIGGYLRGTAITAVVDATLIAIVLVVVGVPLVAPLAMLTFFGAFFPLVGAVFAGLVASLVALVSGGFVDAAIVAAATLVIQQVEGDVLQPIVMGRAVKLHPVAILLALAAGGTVAGVVGAFLAVPVAAVAATVGNYVRLVHSPPARTEAAPAETG